MKHDFMAFQRQKKELNIKARVILNESARKSETVSFAYAQFHYIPDSNVTPTSTFVYGDNSAIIIWGENDKITPLSDAKAISKQIKNSKLYVIDGARHAPQFTHTKEVVNKIFEET